jgi:hypothetical protein
MHARRCCDQVGFPCNDAESGDESAYALPDQCHDLVSWVDQDLVSRRRGRLVEVIAAPENLQ